MAKKSSGKGQKPRHQAMRKSAGKPKQESMSNPDKGERPKKPTLAKRGKRGKSLIDMDQAVLSVLRLDPSIRFTPKQVKSLLDILILHQSQVTKSLESLHAKSMIVRPDKGSYSLSSTGVGEKAGATRSLAPAGTSGAIASGIDLRREILTALCTDPTGPISSAEVHSRVESQIGGKVDAFDVLNRLVRLAQQGTIRRDGDLFSRDCS